jgi:GNAT superfamily N-acetyltransferase
VSVREATSDDVFAMHEIRLSVLENVLSDPNKITPAHYRRYLGKFAKSWVFVEASQIVGFAAADAKSGNVWALFVRPGHERRGIGRHLHDEMMNWLFATGCDRAWLTTGRSTRAEHFYLSAGWTPVETTPTGEIVLEKRRDA